MEGLCQGIDEELVERTSEILPSAFFRSQPFLRLCLADLKIPGLGEWVTLPCTYAGGARDISDLALVDQLSNGKVDLTFGSYVYTPLVDERMLLKCVDHWISLVGQEWSLMS